MSEEKTFYETASYLRGKSREHTRFDAVQFEKSIELMDNFFNERLRKANDAEKQNILKQQHRATTGHPQVIQEMKSIVRQLIEEFRLQDVSFPPMYESLVDALYHETWGLGAVSIWYERHREVSRCRVNGCDVWYRLSGERHRLHEQYRDSRGVERMVQNLLRNDDQQVISRGHESAEFHMYDGTRVTISLPPLVRYPTVVFRRPVVQKYTLLQQAELGTIPKAAIPIYRMIARCGTKAILTGEPGTGKTTFLVSLFAETKPDKVTTCCENVFEIDLKRKFPDRDITEYQGHLSNMASVVIPLTLRQDTRQYIMQEVREVEAPALKEACTNTTGLVLSTMHESDSTNVPGTLARKELRQSSGMNYRVCLTEYASKLDIVMVMAYGEEETVIRNVEIAVLELEPFTLSITSRRILWFDGEIWRFSAHMESRLAARMSRYDSKAFHEGMALLRELAEQFPIPPEEQAITLNNAGLGG